MTIIHELPLSVISELEQNEAALWAWASERYYTQMLEQVGDHLLVSIKQGFDLLPLMEACRGFRLYSGKQGQEATHELGQLCHSLMLKYICNWSLRKTAEEVRCNTLMRWFAGYRLNEATFSHSTLARFEQWVFENEARLYFDVVLKQIDVDFPDEQNSVQIGDTFAMRTAVNPQSRTEMLRHGCQKMLDSLKLVAPLGYGSLLATLDQRGLFGEKNARHEFWLKGEEHKALEERTALAASHCLLLIDQVLAGRELPRTLDYNTMMTWQKRVAKILQDEFKLTTDENGKVTKATLYTAEEKKKKRKREPGTYRYGSMLDPEATYRKHGDKNDFGYNVSLATTPNFIREIAAATGATPDASGIPLLLEAQKEHLGVIPPKLIYDQAAGYAKHFYEVDKVSEGQTQLVARIVDNTKNSTRFGPQDFVLQENGELLCPNGVATSRAYRSNSADGWDFKFPASECRDCPLWDLCRTPKAKPTTRRSVFVSRYRYHQRQALAYTKTAQFDEEMKLRPQVERVIAGLVRYNGARRAKSVGLAKADFQAKMNAMAYNLKRWHTLMTERNKPNKIKSPSPAG